MTVSDKNLLSEVREILLMGPGPSYIPPEVYEAIALPTMGHMDPTFIKVLDGLKGMLREVMMTGNQLTFPVSGTGSAGMETCFVNLVEKGDKVLVLVNGVFGKRMTDVAQRLGAEVDTLDFEWGTPVEVDAVKKQLDEKKYDIVAVVHAETSTGVRNPVAEISELVQDNGALYLVDAVTSLGGMPVKTDEWKIDALYSGTQKCLSCPPGLAPVSFSKRATDKVQSRSSKVPNWYLDVTMIIDYWQGEKRVYHHTAPVNMLYALYAALRVILDEGLDAVFARHQRVHEELVAGLKGMGFDMLADEDFRLPMLNAVKIPDGIDEAAVRGNLLKKHDIEIGAGLGPLAGK
ncbi:MAG: pyridoxal-phosphate-dependent aminotransferase family protein, partial [Candidatus Sumerlaeota bacterium]